MVGKDLSKGRDEGQGVVSAIPEEKESK